MLSIFVQGFFLQSSLILALGAQNIFVLNSGLMRQRHLLVAFVSSVCDTVLILIGVLGVATFFIQFPVLKVGLGLVGVSFLAFYGFVKLREARRGLNFTQSIHKAKTIRQTIITSLGFSLLNPHVYLDTVVLVGGYATKFSHWSERFYFGGGASAFSIIWFFGLAILASLGNRLLSSSNAMRTISFISGLILISLAIKLGMDVFGWMKNDF